MKTRGTRRVLLIIENVSLARDHRARKQIASLLSAGYRVGLICRRDEHNAGYRQPGLELYEYPGPPERGGTASFIFEYAYSLLAALVLMLRARADGAVHAIQSGQPPDTYFLATLPAKLFGARLVVDQRDLSPEVYADRFGKRGGPIAVLLRALERVSWRSADHVITVNGSLVTAIATRGRVPRERVTAVGNGPLLSAINGRVGNERLREGFPYLVCWLAKMRCSPSSAMAKQRRICANSRRNSESRSSSGSPAGLPRTRVSATSPPPTWVSTPISSLRSPR
jgi:Glycosyl transferase 4-like domain